MMIFLAVVLVILLAGVGYLYYLSDVWIKRNDRMR